MNNAATTRDNGYRIEHVDFGVRDERGRSVGRQVECWFETSKFDGEVRFFARAWATRNGKHFGAIRPVVSFATREERDAHVAEKLAEIPANVRKLLKAAGVSVKGGA